MAKAVREGARIAAESAGVNGWMPCTVMTPISFFLFQQVRLVKRSGMPIATPRPREVVWREIVKPGGAALGIAGTALAIVQIFVVPDWKISAQWVGALAVATLVAILWFNSALSNALDDLKLERATSSVNENQTPKVVYATINPSEENGVILLLEPHALFGQSMLVSVYSEDERGFEQFVASGVVSNIQMNGKIQVAVTGWEPAHLELQRYVASQDATRLERLIIAQRRLQTPFSHKGQET